MGRRKPRVDAEPNPFTDELRHEAVTRMRLDIMVTTSEVDPSIVPAPCEAEQLRVLRAYAVRDTAMFDRLLDGPRDAQYVWCAAVRALIDRGLLRGFPLTERIRIVSPSESGQALAGSGT